MRRTPRSLAAWLLIITGAALPAIGRACSIGSGMLERDQAHSYASSDEVFIALLSNYRHLPPLPGSGSYRAAMDYVLIDTLKGKPRQRGVLIETDPYKTQPGYPPAPSCGPWLLHADAIGKTALIFTYRNSNGDPALKWVDPFSRFVEHGNADSSEMIDRIRHLSTAPKP